MLGLGMSMSRMAMSVVAILKNYFKADTTDYSVDTTTLRVDETTI